MADNNIKEKTEDISTFNRIIKDTGTEITKLIPTLGSFFAVFQSAQIAGAVRQMADFYQGFKNLSYQMGKSNTASKEFLKNIYKVKIATGDTLDNLNEITVALIKNRVEGGKSLQFLTKQISFFAEATGASVSQSSQLAGELYRIGHLGPKSISSIMTSMLKVQRTVGLTSEEIEGLSQNIIETTTELSNLNKTSAFIENFQKGTIKLASAFRSVGLEATKATDIVDRLLDIDQLENNMLLYSKMGISIQDAVAGNIDPNMMTERLQMVGQEIASMSRPAGAALARQMGISYREALQYQNLRPTGDISTEDSDMEKMAKEQRTLWTKIEKFFNSGIGWLASKFLENPLMFGGIIAVSFMTFGKKVMGWMKTKFHAIADDMGKTIANVVDLGLNKSGTMKELRKNAGLKSGKYSSGSLIDQLNASRDRARNRDTTTAVNLERAMNAISSNSSNYDFAKGEIGRKRSELTERLNYLEATGRRGWEQRWINSQLGKLDASESGLDKQYNKTSIGLDKNYQKALGRLSVEQVGQRYIDAQNAKAAADKSQLEFETKLKGLNKALENAQTALYQAEHDPTLAHTRDSLVQSIKNINAEIDDANRKVDEFGNASKKASKEMELMAETGKLHQGVMSGGYVGDRTFSAIPGKQHEFWFERIGPAMKRFGGVLASPFVKAFGVVKSAFLHPLRTISAILSFGFKMLMRFLLPLGLVMGAMMVISKILQRFSPLMDMLTPIIEKTFDLLATIIAPIIKVLAKIAVYFLGGIYNGIVWIVNLFKKNKFEYLNLSGILSNIDSWNVGDKMDKEAENNSMEKNAVIMKSNGSGQWVAQNPENADKYWSGGGFGSEIAKMNQYLDSITEASRTTVAAIDRLNDTQKQTGEEIKKGFFSRIGNWWSEKSAGVITQ